MKNRVIFLALALVLAAGAAVFAQKPDIRVADALDAVDVTYTVTDSGDFQVIFSMENNPDRAHVAYVVSGTETYWDLEIREIWALAAVLDELPDTRMLSSLLQTNSTIKIGSWGVDVWDDGEVWILYTIKVPADLDGGELATLIYFAAEICDEFEEANVGDDVF